MLPITIRRETGQLKQLFDNTGVSYSWSEEMMEYITMVLVAIGTVGLLVGREWYNSLAGLVLAVLGLWIGGYFPR